MNLLVKIAGTIVLLLIVAISSIYIYLYVSLHSNANVIALIEFVFSGETAPESLLTKKIVLVENDLVVNDEFSVKEYCSYSFYLNLPSSSDNENADGEPITITPDYRKTYFPVSLDIYKITEGDALVQVYSYQGISHAASSKSFWITSAILDRGQYFAKLRFLAVQIDLLGLEAELRIREMSKSTCPEKSNETVGNTQSEFVQEGTLGTNPDVVAKLHQKKILVGEMVAGMTPYEAMLAGGKFNYDVKPDYAVWSKKFNPLAVLYAQSRKPDNSEIKMTFSNSTQFVEEHSSIFTVVFRKGRAVEIVNGKNE